MALIWQKNKGGNRYQIRTAGHSVRLYTNGVFHSQYNHKNPFQGQLWELLALPALLLGLQECKTYLLLGVGGGAVIKLLQDLQPTMRGVGVELEAMHIQLARRFFKADQSCRLVQADALNWLAKNKSQKFKLIIDDLFGSDGKSQPGRAVTADIQWLEQLQSLLDKKGILVMNMESSKQANALLRLVQNHSALKFQQALLFSADHYENVVLAFLNASYSKREINDLLASFQPVKPYFFSARARFKFRLKSL